MSPIKLLLITNRYPAHADDAASPFVADFVRGLAANDIDCTVLTPYHRASRYDDDVKVVRFLWGEDKKTIGTLPIYAPDSWLKIMRHMKSGNNKAEQLHRDRRYNFCLALWAAPSGIFAYNLFKGYNLPYSVWCLGSDIHTYAKYPLVKGRIKAVLKNARKVYCDGINLAGQAELMSGVKCDFMPSLRKINFTPEIKDAAKSNLLVCPGRVERAKGVFDLLEAFRQIAAHNSDWSLTYIGSGGALGELQAKIKEFNLQNSVRTTGFLPSQEMWRIMAEAKAIIIPTHADSLPLTFGEAMQLQRPVIAADVGDLRHFIDKYGVGKTAPAQAPDNLARVIDNFINGNIKIAGEYAQCVSELSLDASVARFSSWLKDKYGVKEKREKATV